MEHMSAGAAFLLSTLSDEGDSPYPGKNLNEDTLAHANQQIVH
jgi:hypothetical protein